MSFTPNNLADAFYHVEVHDHRIARAYLNAAQASWLNTASWAKAGFTNDGPPVLVSKPLSRLGPIKMPNPIDALDWVHQKPPKQLGWIWGTQLLLRDDVPPDHVIVITDEDDSDLEEGWTPTKEQTICYTQSSGEKLVIH